MAVFSWSGCRSIPRYGCYFGYLFIVLQRYAFQYGDQPGFHCGDSYRIGYSINDTVIIFDRIREYLREKKALHWLDYLMILFPVHW
jgi:hypothetical protein